MSYSPINSTLFAAAYAGALAGMVASGRYISASEAVDYATLSPIAGAFAQAFDTAWNDGSAPTQLEVQATQSLSEAVFEERQPVQDAAMLLPATWLSLAKAVAAAAQAGDEYFSSIGVASPVWSSGGSTSLVFQPEGVAGGNVYTTWQSLISAIPEGSYTITIDTTFGAANVPVGLWDLKGPVTLVDHFIDTLNFADGAELEVNNRTINITGLLRVNSNSSSPVASVTGTGISIVTVDEEAFLESSTSAPFFSCDGEESVFIVYGSLGDGTHPVIDVTTLALINGYNTASIANGSLTSTGSGVGELEVDATCTVGTGLGSGWSTTHTTQAFLSAFVSSTPADWATAAPTDPQTAINRLATAVEGILGHAIP